MKKLFSLIAGLGVLAVVPMRSPAQSPTVAIATNQDGSFTVTMNTTNAANVAALADCVANGITPDKLAFGVHSLLMDAARRDQSRFISALSVAQCEAVETDLVVSTNLSSQVALGVARAAVARDMNRQTTVAGVVTLGGAIRAAVASVP